MQPEYDEIEYKINARAENVDIFRRVMKMDSIPLDREYWTLCNVQNKKSGAEIVQMEDMGLIHKRQFHGVDRDPKIIKQNIKCHPDAHWYSGEWDEVIEENKFNPAMIYLDMTAFTDNRIALNLTVNTMLLCPSKTLLLINTMLNDPRSRRTFDPREIISNLSSKIPTFELKLWDEKVESYTYSATGRTSLVTHVLHKK